LDDELYRSSLRVGAHNGERQPLRAGALPDDDELARSVAFSAAPSAAPTAPLPT
jgi:hypothetical protein